MCMLMLVSPPAYIPVWIDTMLTGKLPNQKLEYSPYIHKYTSIQYTIVMYIYKYRPCLPILSIHLHDAHKHTCINKSRSVACCLCAGPMLFTAVFIIIALYYDMIYILRLCTFIVWSIFHRCVSLYASIITIIYEYEIRELIIKS